MSEDIISMIKENVIQGRKTRDDIGIDESLTGKPGVVELVESALSSDISPEIIIKQALTSGMEIVGEKFSTKEYFISELVMSGEIFKGIMSQLEPLLGQTEKSPSKGTVVIGTVKNDIHDIGKNIVAILLKGAGYEVIDIGIDVPEDKIIDVVKSEKPDYLGLSALLTTTMTEMDIVVKALKENGLREEVKVLIGGAAVSDEYAEDIGADAFCADGFQAIKALESF